MAGVSLYNKSKKQDQIIKWKDKEKTRAMWLLLTIIMLARMMLMKIICNHIAFLKLNKLPVWLSKSSLFPFQGTGAQKSYDFPKITGSSEIWMRVSWLLWECLLHFSTCFLSFPDWLGVSLHDLWTWFSEKIQHVLFSPVAKMKLVNNRITNYEQWWFRRPDFRLFSYLVNSHYGKLPGYSSWKDSNYSLFKGFN